jgi:class 3 adenylate cyclase
VSHVLGSQLEAGREAVDRHAWNEGYELLQAADGGAALAPADLERLGSAAWWMGRLEDCISARERAFAAYLEAGNHPRAAIVAMALAKDYYAKRASAIAAAWVNRAERLLAEEPDCGEHGHLERLRGVLAYEGAGDYGKALEHGERALEIATRFGDRDLQAIALHDQGRALAATGRVEEGMALMDEANVAAVSGELAPYETGVVYCNTISACKELADYRRAGDWTEAAKRWCERQAITGFPGMCRVYRASVLLMRGAWPEAEREARRACDELEAFNLSYAAEAFYELGEVRMRIGDSAAAEQAFRQAHELGRDPQPGLALLRLAEGKTEGACSCIDRALDEESRDPYRARLLPAKVEIAVAVGDAEAARRAAEELGVIARTYGSDALQAMAHTARARVLLADSAGEAVESARQALRLWQGVDVPYEAAEVRMLLAAGYRAEGDTDDAILELAAALTAFERLGAAADVREAHAQLEGLGGRRESRGGVNGRIVRTFMFTDIVRSTNLVDAIGDESWSDLVRWHDETLRSLFAAHEGEEIDHAGDGFFVAFADAASAIECAVAVQRRLAKQRRTQGFAPEIRIGLHAAEASRRGAEYKGKGVHEAARISSLADGGEILASAASVSQEPIRFPVSEPRSVELKGVAEPVEIISIDWR